MSRKYLTSPTMLHDKCADKVVQPDLKLVETLHKLLDMIPQNNLALSIDLCVAELIRFHNPPNINQASLANPEYIEPRRTN
jgi:hypothetical protein